jgi:hypothetical protein
MSESASATVDISGAVAYLNRNIHRFEKTKGEGVRLLAREVAGALAASTKVSAKTRPIVARKPGQNVTVPGIFYARKFGKAGQTFIPIKAETKEAARADKRAIIRRRGLARSAWFWVMSELGGAGATFAVRKDRRKYGLTKQLSGNDPAIRIESKLVYASDAFRTKGTRGTIDTAGRRALNRVTRMIEKRIAADAS